MTHPICLASHRYFNQIDARKKLRLVSFVEHTTDALASFFEEGHVNIVTPKEGAITARKEPLKLAEDNFVHDEALWRTVRSRLEAELQGKPPDALPFCPTMYQPCDIVFLERWCGLSSSRGTYLFLLPGALPPPGAPVGALSPVCPRQDLAAPPYLSTLTTEVLGKSTKTASYQDLCHARDEGVLKQGFLITPAAFGWARKRRWYRLHDGSLYYLAVSAAYDPVFVLSLKEANVSLSAGKALHLRRGGRGGGAPGAAGGERGRHGQVDHRHPPLRQAIPTQAHQQRAVAAQAPADGGAAYRQHDVLRVRER